LSADLLFLLQRFAQLQKAVVDSGEAHLQPCVKVRGNGRLSSVCTTQQFVDLLSSIRECYPEVKKKTPPV